MVLNHHSQENQENPATSTFLSGDPETRQLFLEPPLIAYRRDRNLCDILVHTTDTSQPGLHAGRSPCSCARCHYCHHISNDATLQGPKFSTVIKEAFTCQTSGLVYCIFCRRYFSSANTFAALKTTCRVFLSLSILIQLATVLMMPQSMVSCSAAGTSNESVRRCVLF